LRCGVFPDRAVDGMLNQAKEIRIMPEAALCTMAGIPGRDICLLITAHDFPNQVLCMHSFPLDAASMRQRAALRHP